MATLLDDAVSRAAREAENLAAEYARGSVTADEYYERMERLAHEAIRGELDATAERRAAEHDLAPAGG